jgi:hypothetical protein
VQVNNIGLLPVINIRSLPLDKPENKFLKRGFDIVFSLLFFILLGWWLMPIISLLIRLSSKGPAIFKQERWGINNEKIVCYKFRTMVTSSNDIDEDGNYDPSLLIQLGKNGNLICVASKEVSSPINGRSPSPSVEIMASNMCSVAQISPRCRSSSLTAYSR